MIKTTKIILICSVILFLTGCTSEFNSFPIPEEDNNNSLILEDYVSENNIGNEIELFPEHIIDNENDILKVDADVIIPSDINNTQELRIYKSDYNIWNDEIIVNTMIEEELVPTDGIIDIDRKTYDNEFNNGQEIVRYGLNNDCSIAFSCGSVFFSTYKSVRNQYNHVFDYYKNYISEKGLTELLTDEEIKGISRIDALDKTSRLLQLLGLSDKVLPPQVYPLKHEIINKINKEENATNKYGEGVTILEENDDAYLIFYPVVTDNIPSSNIFANGANEILDCSKVFFIYSNEGIIEIYVSGIMSETEVLKSSQIISPVKAVNILSDSYSDILTDTRISVSLIKLVSIQRKVFKENTTDFYTEPVWLLYGKFTDTNDSENKKSLNDTDAIAFVSAVTGEIIPVNSVGG